MQSSFTLYSTFTVKEIKVKELPEINDDFAKDVSEFDTLDEYKNSIKEKLDKSNEARTKAEFENALVEAVCENAEKIAVLENVVNPTNIGAIFRSAAALGFDAVLLTKACSDPLYRRSARVSMGTVFQIDWTYFDGEISTLRKLGFKTAAMALDDNSIGIDDSRLTAEKKLAVVLGTEGDGLSAKTISDCDYTVKIPMAHGVDSLNVAAASAVAFWELRKR